MPNCIVCKTSNAWQEAGSDFARCDCDRCGSFILSGTSVAVLPDRLNEKPLRRSLMSHALRKMQLSNDKHLRIIMDSELDSFWSEARLPTPMEQADNLIVLIGDMQETPSSWAWIKPSVIASTIGIALSSTGDDNQGWGWLHSQLIEKHQALGEGLVDC